MANDLVTRLILNNKNFDSNLTKSTKQVREFQRKLDTVSKGFQQGFGNIPQVFNPLSSGFTSLGVKAGIAGVAIAGVGKVISENIKLNSQLDYSLSGLAAILGKSSKEMNGFREAAIELGATTPQTANEVAEAFRVVAQLNPELAKSKEGLVNVTRAALNLANAQGTDVATSSEIVVRALNQFGASTIQARHYADVLAEGMRRGSGDIQWLGEALGKAGSTAKIVGMSFEETVAVLEKLSTRIKDAQSAGSQLRNVLMYLEKQNDNDLKPSVVGVAQAFKNLRDRQYNLTELQAIFKKQNIETVATLIDECDTLEDLTKNLKESNSATEMAEERQNNLSGATKRLDSAWEGFLLRLGNSTKVIAPVVDKLADFLNVVAGINKELAKFKEEEGKKYDSVIMNIGKSLLKNNPNFTKDQLKESLKNQIESEIKSIQKELSGLQFEYDSMGRPKPSSVTNVKQRRNQLTARLQTLQGILNGELSSYIDSIFKDNSPSTPTVNNGFDLETASLKELKDHLKEIKKLRDEANDLTTITKYNAEIEETNNKIKELQGNTTNAKSKLPKINLSDADPFPSLEELMNNYSDRVITALITSLPQSINEVDKMLKKWKELYGNAGNEAGREYAKKVIEALKAKKNEMEKGISSTYANGLGAIRDKMNKNSQNLKPNTDYIDDENKALEKTREAVDNLKSSFNSLFSAMNQLGKGPALFATIAQSVAQAIPQVINMVSAFSALAVAQGVSEASRRSWYEAIAAAAALAATIISTVATVKSQTKGYATGGIVGGNSYVGDKQTVRVNSGEMILNKQQQANLFRMLNQGTTSSNSGSVKFKVEGKDLVGVLNNYSKQKNRVI